MTTAASIRPGISIRPGAGKYLVLPEWGRVSWAVTGSFTGVEIALYARG